MMPPRLNASGKSLDHPHPRLSRRLGAESEIRAPSLVHCHAFRNQLVPAEQLMDEITGLGIVLKTGVVAPRLMVQQNNLGAVADALVIEKALAVPDNRTANHC